MRRALLLCVAVLALLAGIARAEDGVSLPINPWFRDAMICDPQPSVGRLLSRKLAAKDDAVIECVCIPADEVFRQDTCWTVSITRGSGEETEDVTDQYNICVYLGSLIDPAKDVTASNLDVHYFRPWQANAGFSYRFVAPGTYYIRVDAYKRDGGAPNNPLIQWFPVDPEYTARSADNAEGVSTVAERVTEVAEACTQACGGERNTDYHKALWLHDWLTTHARYDDTYSFYSADAALIRGTCVCDGYSKAYALLLDAVGIANARVTSMAQNHSWNLAKLDGAWYWIDVTWDDPIVSGVSRLVSGKESHVFFGLNDRIFQESHTLSDVDYSAANDLADNYYVREGRLEGWMADLKADVLDGLALDEGRLMATGRLTLDYMEAPAKAGTVTGDGDYAKKARTVLTGLFKWYMCASDALPLTYADGRRVAVTAGVTLEKSTFTSTLSVPALALPSGLVEVGGEAFAGNDALLAAVVWAGVERIGARAFADCGNLWRVYLYGEDTKIDVSAFDGTTGVTVVCPANSATEAAARAAGVAVETLG